jgi:hypothetical protein
MGTKIRICKLEKIDNIVEDRVQKISLECFLSLLKNTYKNFFVYKEIYNPEFIYGYYKKTLKKTSDNYLGLDTVTKDEINMSYPKKNFSLVCSTHEENELGTTFLVFPFKNSFFAIKEGDKYFKGYWSDKIKWLEKFDKNELWTEDDCILIKKSAWVNIKNEYRLK